MTEEDEIIDRRQEASSDEVTELGPETPPKGKDIMAHLTQVANNSAAMKAASTYPVPGSLNA